MSALTTLRFIFHPSLTYLDPNTFHGLVNLKVLHLVKSGVHSVGMLAQALKPSILPKLFELQLNENTFKNISQNDFSPMTGSSLTELTMISCGIEYIHPSSLGPFRELTDVSLGENRFDSTTLVGLLNETFNMRIDLQRLNLYASGFRVSLPADLSEIIAASNISDLILFRNQFDVIDNKTIPALMPNLISLDLSDVSAQTIDNHAFTNFPNLKTLILSNNRLSYFAASNYLSKLSYLELQENSDNYGSEFFLTRSEFHKMPLQSLDLKLSRLLLLTKTDFGYIPHLRTLNLKNCSIIRIEEETFKGLENLTFLSLENNMFFERWIMHHFDIFEGLGNLKILLLGGNDISHLRTPRGYLLKYLENLRTLGLNRNNLQVITYEDFAPLKKLERLDISYNFLIAWDDRIFLQNNLIYFKLSGNKLAYLSDGMVRDFHNLTFIDLDFNSFSCNCRFSKKLSSNKDDLNRFLNLIKNRDVFCLKPSNVTLGVFYRNVRDSLLDCDMKKDNALVVIIPSVIVLVILTVLGVLGYVYRWHIKYWAFLVKLHLIKKGKIGNVLEEGYVNYQYDAFVSYCNQDQNFVVRLVNMLENYEPYLKLCVYERDFQVGSVLAESVLENITHSRKTLIIVSNSYAKSYWCKWESQIVEHHRLFFENPNLKKLDQSIVLIKLGPLDESHLTPTLKYLLKTRIYLQWDPEEEKQKIFWRKLRQFLAPNKEIIVHYTHI
ncbi:hypothetical protein WA026_010978 [Henosepilachna vigintioctopunctata]|uniref:TIR domain-containing protein n=1 Tax=Henosepilachna vigintioctopunctata TaxID=420089 RepID=A0AAW1UXB7_9CUCU